MANVRVIANKMSNQQKGAFAQFELRNSHLNGNPSLLVTDAMN